MHKEKQINFEGNVILQSDPNHTSRLAEYLPEVFPECSLLKQVPSLVFLKTFEPENFLQKLFKHDTLYRYLHRCFVYQHTTKTLDLSVIDMEDKTFRVQAFPKSTESAVIKEIPLRIPLHPKDFTHFLSVVFVDGLYFSGIAPKSLFFSVENAVHSISNDQVSRAYYKIKEVVERMPIKLNDQTKAIDIGAAPGGWTWYLSKYVGEVVAVDPAELKIQIKPNIKHIKIKAEEALQSLEKESYDLAVCDVNHDGKILFDILEKLCPLIKIDGLLILTIKMPKRTKSNIENRLLVHQKELIYRFPEFVVLRTFWLLANTYERCLVARKKPENFKNT